MALNTFEYTRKMQTKLDQQIVREATSGWMEENAGQVEYNGGKKIALPTIGTTGLGDYDRDAGFNRKGKVTLEYTDYEMTQDRAASFQLDAMDVNETNFVANAANTIRVFQSDHVVPEIDAYRYATLATKAAAASNTEGIALTADNALDKFREHLRAVRDYVGQDATLICTITSGILAMIEDSPKITRTLNVTDFKQGSISLRLKELDDCVFRVVPQARMHTKFVFNTGETDFGFKPDASAKAVQWLICPRSVPIAISKTDNLRVFEPNINQAADAWKIDYRKYHDLWVLKSREKALFACTTA